MKMTIEEFGMELKNELERRNPGMDVSLQKVTKLNSVELYGLSARNKEVNIAPTIYLETPYDAYVAGDADLETIVRSIESKLVSASRPSIDISWIENWEEAKDKIIPCIVSVDGNEEMLKSTVTYYEDNTGLAYYGRIAIDDEFIGKASILVKKELFKKWNVSECDYFHQLEDNATYMEGAVMMPMTNVLLSLHGIEKELSTNGAPYKITDEKDMLYVLTNHTRIYGAGVSFSQCIMDEIADKIGDEYFVIPSSVHELLIAPRSSFKDAEEVSNLTDIIMSVNNTSVEKIDVVSYNLYKYVKGEGLKLERLGTKF